MIQSRRGAPFIVFVAFITTLIFLRLTSKPGSWRERLPQTIGLGEYYDEKDDRKDDRKAQAVDEEVDAALPPAMVESESAKYSGPPPAHPLFTPGRARPLGYNYSKMLVVPRMSSENVDWISEELPDWDTAIYVADDPSAPLHVPKNKGHEAMIYFTYIIDHYDTLPDVVVFMHSHRWAWHNNELLSSDAAEMLRHLSFDRVQRLGYFNMRCHWNPGCPAWMHPGTIDEASDRQEETLIAQAWSEIFPNDPIPLVLAVPCCAQFAVSGDRIRARPKTDYIFYRNWLLQTDLEDYLSGRIWEYLWPVVFVGDSFYCPVQAECYCDGYGMCLGGEDKLDEYYVIKRRKIELEKELKEWKTKANRIENLKGEGKLDEAAKIEVPEVGKDMELTRNIEMLERDLASRRERGLERGQDPSVRAEESNRTWVEGDGF